MAMAGMGAVPHAVIKFRSISVLAKRTHALNMSILCCCTLSSYVHVPKLSGCLR